jgi:hypothetical protein
MPPRRHQDRPNGAFDLPRSHIYGRSGTYERIRLDDDASHDDSLRLVVVQTSLIGGEGNSDQSPAEFFDAADFGCKDIRYGNGLHEHNNSASPTNSLPGVYVAESFRASHRSYAEWLTTYYVAQATFSVAEAAQ